MSQPIEDYGIIGNATPRRWCRATVRSTGYACRASIRNRCLRRCSASRKTAAGCWRRQDPEARCSRAYRGETGILETRFETAEGGATIIDFMPFTGSEDQVDLIRLVRGDTGRVRMRTEIILRFDYGRSIPWVRRHFGGPSAVAGPNAVQFITPVPLRGTPEMTTIGEFTVAAGESVPFTMSWYPSHHGGYRYRDPVESARDRERWHDWSSHCTLTVRGAMPSCAR